MMTYDVETVKDYLEAIPDERVEPINRLRQAIKNHLPDGFEETIEYGMIAYVVPLKRYPKGYHAKKNTPLPFISLASQKKTINLYHHGLYARQDLHDWFMSEYLSLFQRKPDMGKSCIRFKNVDARVIKLVSELAKKMTVEDVIQVYENK